MSFELIDITPFVLGFFVTAGLTTVLAVGSGVEFFASNRKVRVARNESVPTYYGNLLGAH
jgi:hypothetical protein